MTINLGVSFANPTPELRPRISVVGVGGAGGNAVNNMIRARLEGVEFIVANTDAQSIAQSQADRRIQLGVTVTQGLGAGSRPDIGRIAAEEALEEIIEEIRGSNMVFIAAGMGGGTGTGAAPVIARAAREQGILTVGVVTKPFHFEGGHRMRIAEQGIEELGQFVDTLIVIPNQNLFRIANDRTTFAEAFKMADDVLYSGVRGVTDLMVMPGLINLDFADIRAVMSEMGKAMMGTGEADGERRALEAAEAAISNPLLDDVSMKGARGVLINITGGSDMTLFEVDEAANRIRSEVDPDAFIIFGSTFDDELEGKLRVSVVATGMEAAIATAQKPMTTKLTVISRNQDDRKAEESAARNGVRESIVAMARQEELAIGDQGQRPAAQEAAVAQSGLEVEDIVDQNVFIPAAPASRASIEAKRNGGEPVAAEAEEPRVEPEANGTFGKMTTLIARMTGSNRSRSSKAEPSNELIDRPLTETRQAPRFGAVTPEDRLPTSKIEDEVLDIPAFLRRQAN